jgi:hypothetical protein
LKKAKISILIKVSLLIFGKHYLKKNKKNPSLTDYTLIVNGPSVHDGVFLPLKSWSLRPTIAPVVVPILDRIMDCRSHACSSHDDDVKKTFEGTARHRGDLISSAASDADLKLKSSSEESEYTSSIPF